MEPFVLIAFFVGLGISFQRVEAFPPQTVQVLNIFALYVSLPAVILLKVPQISLSGELFIPIAVAWGALLLTAALVFLAARIMQWPRAVTGVLLLVIPLGNTSFMGVPIVSALFGEDGLRHLIIYDQFGTMLIFATYGSLILALYGKEGSVSTRGVARRVLSFPPTIALCLGLTFASIGSYPPLMENLLKVAAGTLTPLIMTAIGLQLRLRLQSTLHAPLAFGLGVKLVVAPLLALLALRWCGVDSLAGDVSIIEAGMPPMVTAGALAIVAGMNAELASALIGLGLLISFATLPLLSGLL